MCILIYLGNILFLKKGDNFDNNVNFFFKQFVLFFLNILCLYRNIESYSYVDCVEIMYLNILYDILIVKKFLILNYVLNVFVGK